MKLLSTLREYRMRHRHVAWPASLLLALTGSPSVAQLPAVHGGNLKIIQNNNTNATGGITLTTDSVVNQFTHIAPSDRGDFSFYVGPVREANAWTMGVYLSAVRQNGRDNSLSPNSGGNTGGAASGKVFSTPALELGANNVWLSLNHAQSGSEFNADTAVLHFPFRTVTGAGWLAGWARNAADGGAITAADSFFTPGIALGSQFLDLGGGQSTLNLTGVPGAPVAASQNGVLLVTGGKNEDNYALGRANADGTFSMFCRDNGNAAAYEQDPVTFVYIPAGSAQVTASRVLGNGSAVSSAGSGNFTTTTAGVAPGQVLLTVPGVTGPNDAVLIVTPEGGAALNADNIVNYEWSTALSGYVVESRDLSGVAADVPALENVGAEPMFSFVLARTQPQISLEEPLASRRFNGSMMEFGCTLPGAPVTKTFTLRNNHAGSLVVSAVTLDGRNAADYSVNTSGMAGTLANGGTTTFSVTFVPAGEGNRIARLLVQSDSSAHPVYDLLLNGGGLSPTKPDIVWVSDNPLPNSPWQDDTDTGPYTDGGFVSLLRNAGHNVIRFNVPNAGIGANVEASVLTPAQLAMLNSADLVMLSRNLASRAMDGGTGLETLQWNTQITKPLLNLNPFTSSATRLGWYNATTDADATPTGGDNTTAQLTFSNPASPVSAFLIGPTAMTGSTTTNPLFHAITSANSPMIGTDRGVNFNNPLNTPAAGATVIATSTGVVNGGYAVITWPAGTVLPGGAPAALTPSGGQTLGGFRMLFCAGNQEPVAPNNLGNAGYENLTIEGEGMFLRAVLLAMNSGTVPLPEGCVPGPAFADSDFAPSDWITLKIVDQTPTQNGTFTTSQVMTGGNPGAHNQTTMSLIATGVGSQGVSVGHFKTSAVYDPAVSGPLCALSFSMDRRLVSVSLPLSGMFYGLALKQGPTVRMIFGPNVDHGPAGWDAWKPYDWGTITNLPAGIDYSHTGAPITFGFFYSTGTPNAVSLSFGAAVDNWRVTTFSGPISAAEIAIEQPAGNDLTDGGTSTFPAAVPCQSGAPRIFTVKNLGSLPLTLTAPVLAGGQMSDFAVDVSAMALSVAPGGITTFAVTFRPSATGSRSTTLQLSSNDADEAVFDITLTGSGLAAAYLDPAFGMDGKVVTSFAAGNDHAAAGALQPDGKIVAAGAVQNGSDYDWAVARYHPDGALDTSFDGDGMKTFSLGPVGSPAPDTARGVAIQADGKIVIVGNSSTNGGDAAVVRLNADGSFDTSFDGDGIVITPLSGPGFDDYYEDIVLQPDGKIVVTGQVAVAFADYDIVVARFSPDGSPDTTFDSDGKVLTAYGSGVDQGHALALQSDGKIVVAGLSVSDFAVVRYLPNGALDTTFDGDGRFTAGMNTGDHIAEVVIQADGKIVACGRADNAGNLDFAAIRVLPNGTLDTSFDTDGRVTIPVGAGNDRAFSVALQADGKILLAGDAVDMAVVRLDPSGSLDSSFGTGGKVIIPFGGTGSNARELLVQPDGTMVLVGNRLLGGSYDFALARLTGTAGSPLLTLTGPAALTVNEGSPAVNTGTFSDPQGNAAVILTASLGTLTRDDTAGTWAWSYTPSNAQAGTTVVTITASDCVTTVTAMFTITFPPQPPEIAVEYPAGTSLSDGSTSLTFGAVPVNLSGAPRLMTVKNIGGSPLAVSGASISGIHAGDFVLSAPGLAGNLAAGANRTFSVSFVPTETGLRTATLQITSDDADETSFDITLTGHGKAGGLNVWHVNQGNIITASTGAGPGALENMFGAAFGSPEPGNAFFRDDQGTGFTHAVEWQIPTAAAVTEYRLHAGDDGPLTTDNPAGGSDQTRGERGFSLARIYGFNTATSAFELLSTFTPNANPYGTIDVTIQIQSPLSTTRYRAEFVQYAPSSFPGPRIAELEGYAEIPPMIPLAPEISIEQPTGTPLGGVVAAWGYNQHNETVVPADLRNVTAVSGGQYHSLARKGDGTVVAWGSNGFGQADVPAGLSDVTAVAAGARHSLALKSDGTIVAWGSNVFGQLDVPSGLSGVNAIAAGGFHSIALKSDGTVVAWGSNSHSQSVVPGDLSGVMAIAAHGDNSLALKSDGTVVAWGGNGGAAPGIMDVPPALAGVTAIAAGYAHGVALKNDGTVVAWGRNDEGQCDVSAGLGSVIAVIAGGFHTTALKADGTVVAWGYNASGQIVPPAGLAGVVALGAGEYHTLALHGNSVDFGAVNTGSVAVRTFTVRNTGTAPLTLTSVSVTGGNAADFIVDSGAAAPSLPAAGSTTFSVAFSPSATGPRSTTLRITSDDADEGTLDILLTGEGLPVPEIDLEQPEGLPFGGVVSAWGLNAQGQNDVPDGLSNVIAISGGQYFTLALKNDGTVQGWGDHGHGQLTIPGDLLPVTAISCGARHSMALQNNGGVRAWGFNTNGQTAVPGDLLPVIAIAAGGHHCLALQNDGTVRAWGSQSHSQSSVPGTLTGVVKVAAYGDTSMALKSDGTVVMWGGNSQGQTDVPEGLTGVVDIACGYGHAYAVKSDGTLVSWGANDFGQRNTPATLTGVVAIACGGWHNVALKSDGTVKAWGYDATGQGTEPAGLTGVTAIAAGEYHTLALRGNASDFGRHDTGTPSGAKTFTIRSSGTGPLAVSSVSLTGGNAGDFALTAAGVPVSLAPDGTLSFTVSFTPSATGVRSTTLRITSDDADEGTLDIALIGFGGTPIQSWREQHFGSTANSGQGANDADPDNDGIPNIVEHALAGDPKSDSQSDLPALRKETYAEGERLTVRFTHNATHSDITIRVQASDHPNGPWTELARSVQGAAFEGPGVVEEVPPVPGSDLRNVTVRDIANVSDQQRRFARVKVEEP